MLTVKFSGQIKFEPRCGDCIYLKSGRKSSDRLELDDPDECTCEDIADECPEVLKVTEAIRARDIESVEVSA
ncbi:hypothetical protein NO1_1996 [Candidatus Termititenax aidoneus]|uniref:Uncharacterized protein n=1 Tax=Termititenax aidoneus TaxID=2218524 RepID=A0A388TDV1_TERA1|nr:hypothetical protein NO1_1996 [Candidatus Termititenax aidoneus]